MNAKLKDYLCDGANYQAQAVLVCMRDKTIEASWDDKKSKYLAEPDVARWENCREQGYIAMLHVNSQQFNICWFEHRNSDAICAIKWEQNTINIPTIDTAQFGDVYKDKWDTSHDVKCGEFEKMADWIWKQFEAFYTEHK